LRLPETRRRDPTRIVTLRMHGGQRPTMSGHGDETERSAGEERTERAGTAGPPADEELDELRQAVEEKYDFENFGPADMAEMTLEEWQFAFDAETWTTGEALLDRVEDDLAARVADREVFARVERHADPPKVLTYSEEGYAVVYPDGSVEGEGTVLRDVKPSVALCSMESYDVPEPPAEGGLPAPESVPEGSGELGNRLLQVIGAAQVLAGLVLLAMGVLAIGTSGANVVLMVVAGLGFLAVGVLLFFVVANARLSDAYRAEEYRNRLRAVGLEDGERPDFLPPSAGGERPPEETGADPPRRPERTEDAGGSDAVRLPHGGIRWVYTNRVPTVERTCTGGTFSGPLAVYRVPPPRSEPPDRRPPRRTAEAARTETAVPPARRITGTGFPTSPTTAARRKTSVARTP
jgi:hypothetical protein